MTRMTRALTLGLVLLFPACAQASNDTTPELSEETPLNIVAVVDPISDLVHQIAGERATVRSLVPSGSDAHTYAPRPRDAIRLAESDLYVDVGIGLNDAATNLAIANMPDDTRIVLLGEALPAETLINDHDDGTGTLGPNPHIWTSLQNVTQAVPVIRDALTRIDPDGADIYRANTDRLLATLSELHGTIQAAINTIPTENRVLVTFHDAWTYFARDYNLTYAVAVQGRDYTDPSAQAVRNLIDQIRALNVVAVFGSAVFPSDVLKVIAEETGATYVTGLSDDLFPDVLGDTPTFADLMRYNATIIVDGLGGDATVLN